MCAKNLSRIVKREPALVAYFLTQIATKEPLSRGYFRHWHQMFG